MGLPAQLYASFNSPSAKDSSVLFFLRINEMEKEQLTWHIPHPSGGVTFAVHACCLSQAR